MGHNSFSHAFLNDAVVKPLCPLANLLVVVFVWAPVLSFVWFVVSLDETQVWLGICGSSGWGFAGRLAGLCVVVVVVICLHFQNVLVLVQSDVLPLTLM